MYIYMYIDMMFRILCLLSFDTQASCDVYQFVIIWIRAPSEITSICIQWTTDLRAFCYVLHSADKTQSGRNSCPYVASCLSVQSILSRYVSTQCQPYLITYIFLDFYCWGKMRALQISSLLDLTSTRHSVHYHFIFQITG